MGIIFGGFLVIGLVADGTSEFTGGIASAIIVIGAMGIGASALMTGLRKINFAPKSAALIATSLGLIAPIILGVQGWDDHDRSNRTPARALAWNYLVSVAPNGILYTNGDNDTFPLWYLQEVEGIRTDVRVANLSLMQTDWYTEQMMMKAYESEPLPIKFREDQILMGFGNTDYVLFVDQEVYSQQIDKSKTDELIQLKVKHNPEQFNRSINNFRRGLVGAIGAMSAKDEKVAEVIPAILEDLANPFENPNYDDYKKVDKILNYIISALNSRKLEGNQELLKQLNDAAMRWTEDWDYLPIDIVMEFVRDDNNILRQPNSGRGFRFFPTKGFILPVNAENAVNAGIISEEDKENCVDEIRFSFRKGGMFRSDVRGLSREEVMMLDIFANFDWTRGVSFSSPGGSDVAKALYARGVLQNVGQIHSLSPLNSKRITEEATEKLHKNVLELYDYGNLKEDGVLVDYYVRRHTSQYRSSYLDLAMAYGRRFQQADSQAQFRNAADTLGSDNQSLKANEAQEAADMVEEVIRHAMEHLPMDRVLDMGEPRPTSAQLPNGRQIFSDGVIPDYISILYRVGKTEYANELADEYLSQIEHLFNYFEYSHPIHAYDNQEDFISMCMNFFRVFRDAYTENAEDHTMAVKAAEMEDRLTKEIVPYIMEGLRVIEVKETKGGRTRTRNMTREAQEFYELYQAILVENGLMEEVRGEN